MLDKNLEIKRIYGEARQVAKMKEERLSEERIADKAKASVMEELKKSRKE